MSNNTSLYINQSVQTLILQFRSILQYAVIKDSELAKSKETDSSKYYSAQFISAKLGTSNYFTYTMFDKDVMIAAGMTYDEIVEATTKDKIPKKYIHDLIELQDAKTISTYVEQNDYYRLIWGYPAFDDPEVIYAPPEFYESIDIPPRPVHLLSPEQILLLERYGYLHELKLEYPDKEYLYHMGYMSVEPFDGRMGNDFECLKLDISKVDVAIYERFMEVYEASREYHMTCIYNKDLAKSIEYYRNFLGFSIMFYAYQNLITATFKDNISKDFIDLPTIKIFYNAYKVPFVDVFTLEQHKDFAKNLNYLLQYKSTDAVMYELFKIFGTDNFVLYSYYLIKQRKLDKLGQPVFVYKNENGNKVLDLENMYNFHFQMVDSRIRNLAKAFDDETLRHEYESVISGDPYWVDDYNLRQKLLNSQFNYLESKYMGLSIMYKYTETVFDSAYAMSLILDSRGDVEKISLEIPQLLGVYQTNLFGAIALLQGLFSKKMGYKARVLHTGDQITKIYGFNFKNNTDAIRQALLENPLADPRLKDLVKNRTFVTAEDVDEFFIELMEFKDIVDLCMLYSKTVEEYDLYNMIYKTLMIRSWNRECWTMKDGVEAIYLNDFLEDYDTKLYDVLSTATDETVDQYMSYIIDAVVKEIPSMMSLYSMSDTTSRLIDGVMKLMMYFKSYTTDIIRSGTRLVFDSYKENLCKQIDEIVWIERTFNVNETMDIHDVLSIFIDELIDSEVTIIDRIYEIFSSIEINEPLELRDWYMMWVTMLLTGNLTLTDELKWDSEWTEDLVIRLYEELTSTVTMDCSLTIQLVHVFFILVSKKYQDAPTIFDFINSIDSSISLESGMTTSDEISYSDVTLELSDTMTTRDESSSTVSRHELTDIVGNKIPSQKSTHHNFCNEITIKRDE